MLIRLYLTGPTVPDPLLARGRVRCHHVSQRWKILSTCGRGPGPPRVGPGPPRAIQTPTDGSGTSTCHPDSRKLSTQLAAREGSGAATCHADTGAGGDRADVRAPAGGMVVAVGGGTILQAWRGGVPRVLQARVLSRSMPEPLPRVVPMPFEGSAEGKVRMRYVELVV